MRVNIKHVTCGMCHYGNVFSMLETVSLIPLFVVISAPNCVSRLQAVNVTGEATALEATDVSLQLTVATTPAETTSLYIFLGGTAINELNDQLKAMGEAMPIDPCSSRHVSMLQCSTPLQHTPL